MKVFCGVLLMTVALTINANAAAVKSNIDTWDWATPMKALTKKFNGTQGVVMHFGDSLTYANQATRWAWFYGFNKTKGGYTDSDKMILEWSHASKKNHKDNGWWQAKDDAATGRSHTAASGIRTDQYIKGGYRGMPSLKDQLTKYNPQIAVVLLGTNDAKQGKKVDAVVANMKTIISTIKANNTIPVIVTIPPAVKFNDTVKAYNAAYAKLAKDENIPLADLYGEIMARASDTYKTTILHKDGIHFTHKLANGPATDDNLKNCGYLLRCWVVVQKLKDVKAKAID